ncbi:hypothetical protein [Streptomyces lavendulae]|uniref:hypothetical protein n=1 Tax=Streptomyces lavendulae TaxID=1914 RepID=UPI00340757A3
MSRVRAFLARLRTALDIPPEPEHIGGPAWDCPACLDEQLTDPTCPAHRKGSP